MRIVVVGVRDWDFEEYAQCSAWTARAEWHSLLSAYANHGEGAPMTYRWKRR